MQNHYDENDARQKLRLNPPMVVLGVLALLFVAYAILNEGQPRAVYGPASENIESDLSAYDAMGAGASNPAADADGTSYSIDRVDRTLLRQEREQWASDPESYGFNESDRAFLEEHGVSESEGRAMETILRENGVD